MSDNAQPPEPLPLSAEELKQYRTWEWFSGKAEPITRDGVARLLATIDQLTAERDDARELWADNEAELSRLRQCLQGDEPLTEDDIAEAKRLWDL
jgi:hypothetical protein